MESTTYEPLASSAGQDRQDARPMLGMTVSPSLLRADEVIE